ncbi:MAG: sugar ABC transporter ATP-binding protein, partial [Mesorhizobium sp.]
APGRTILELNGLEKRYPGTHALKPVHLAFKAGEIHAIVGENGAGKSTFMRLLSGYIEPTEGTLSMAGHRVRFSRPDQAQAAGIALVHQEILLADALSVTDNLFLGRELTKGGLVDDARMRRLAAAKLAELGCEVSATSLVRDISLADRQLVQIARALLDE